MVRSGGDGGVPCVARRRPQTRTYTYPGVQFNLTDQLLIPDPSPAPVPAGDWRAQLRGSSVSRTLQWRLLFVRLLTPVLEKAVLPSSLP